MDLEGDKWCIVRIFKRSYKFEARITDLDELNRIKGFRLLISRVMISSSSRAKAILSLLNLT